ncbi:Negative cofactor 2 complex subunit alpha [Candida viswanathii]|uniref:Negative cofactor 2 complex subunit alpha n=1 Tax=Candida viswanathii TaxID=5486 RepID=A0A367XYS8_9ASCO|nr:Negative cofactor 2 complex subunit alpha [Candida viswanathii]
MSNLLDLINHDDDGYLPSPPPPQPPQPAQEPQQQQEEAAEDQLERIKTHFPAARIKKIMQSDEEIGKVAQATPIIVGRALEIFMANLKQGVKRITASHVKSAIENAEQFDFLVEAVEKYPSLKN